MLLQKSTRSTKILGLAIIVNLNLVTFTNLVTAQTINLNTTSLSTKTEQSKQSNTDSVASSNRSGLPINRMGGGSRGDCFASNHHLVALVPEDRVSLTASTSPKLFFYIPETTKPHTIEFVLRDRNDKLVYEAFLDIDQQSGIMGVELPASVKSEGLETNQDYHWYLSMICDPQRRSRDVVVEGLIRRVEISSAVKQQLKQSDILEQANLYHQQSIWHDALAVLAQEKDSLAAKKWTELLNSVGLGNLAEENFINSDQIKTSANLITQSH